MSIKSKALGLGAALALSLGVVAPAAADPVNVSVTVQDASIPGFTFSILSGSNATFGNIGVEAVGTGAGAAGGTTTAGSIELQVEIAGDDQLYRDAGEINIKLGTGANADAFLDLTGGDPSFDGSFFADFQIPGRYLSVSGLNNPQQAKYTLVGTGASAAQIWDGTFGRVPREAGSIGGSGQPIYKVGDIGGTFNSPHDTAGCNVTTGTAVQAWPALCGDPAFSEGNVTKQIAYIRDGSGFVTAVNTIELSLAIPAGVYPGTYTGVLTLEASFS